MTKSTTKSFLGLALATALMGSSVGCTSLSVSKEASWKPTTWFKKEFQEPGSIATIWKADMMPQPAGPSQRGFGARVYFYNERSQAIPVEGDLIVHGYLTTPGTHGTSPDQPCPDQPDKKFVFTAEQLASQYSPSDMGASYSIWVPWDAEGGFREEVTLIATFKSKRDSVVQGEPTRLFLPGNARFPEPQQRSQPIQQVSYEHSSIPTYDLTPAPAKPPTRITTIELPHDSQLVTEPETVSVGGKQRVRTR